MVSSPNTSDVYDTNITLVEQRGGASTGADSIGYVLQRLPLSVKLTLL